LKLEKVEANKYIGPSRPGKKLTILGDCYECSQSLIAQAANSDLLIHECTLEEALRDKAVSYGHSTPSMAAEVANGMTAKAMILNHFSQRYKPVNYVSSKGVEVNNNLSGNNDEDEIEDNVQKLVDQAQQFYTKGVVTAAYDLLTVKLQ
jgi:ribonuclease Z